MLATTLRVAKQWCPPHIAASRNWRTGIADHKVGSGFMGWDCEGWKHHGFWRLLALMQDLSKNDKFNLIILVTLTQFGTTKCEWIWTNAKWPDPVLSVWCCARRENSTVALVGVKHKTSPWKQNQGCRARRVSWVQTRCQWKQSADCYGLQLCVLKFWDKWDELHILHHSLLLCAAMRLCKSCFEPFSWFLDTLLLHTKSRLGAVEYMASAEKAMTSKCSRWYDTGYSLFLQCSRL